MTKPRIAVIGAGLMGHGIAQAFALAGHEVNVTDTVMKNLESLERRIAANLRDLGDDESALARVRSCVDLSEAVWSPAAFAVLAHDTFDDRTAPRTAASDTSSVYASLTDLTPPEWR